MSGSRSDLKLDPFLRLGFADGADGQVVYKLRGQMVGKIYQISLEVTNHTDAGTYASAFTLESLFHFYHDALDQYPDNEKDVYEWIKSAFGPDGIADFGAPRWEGPDSVHGPRLTAKYKPNKDQNPESLSLPPLNFKNESDGFPLCGNLPPAQASEVRGSITDAAIKKALTTEAKLKECKQQNASLATVVDAVLNMQLEEDKGVRDVIKMLRGLSGTIQAALESEEEEEEEAAAVGDGGHGLESEGQSDSQIESQAKRRREMGSRSPSVGPVVVQGRGRGRGHGRGRRGVPTDRTTFKYKRQDQNRN